MDQPHRKPAPLRHAQSIQDDGQDLANLQSRLLDAQRSYHLAHGRLSELEGRIDGARRALATLEARLEQVKAAPNERYHVFDRTEPRPGVIWTVEVRRMPDPLLPSRSEEPVRRYLVAAGSHREAEERVVQRFPRNAGHGIGTTAPCSLFGDRNGGAGSSDQDGETAPLAKGRSLRAQRMPS